MSKSEVFRLTLLQISSIYKSLKSIEAEERINFICDVGSLFAKKNEHSHFDKLIKQANDFYVGDKSKNRLMIDDSQGVSKPGTEFVPGKSYLVV